MKFIKIENHSTDPSVRVVSLNRPEVKNAFHPEMITEITQTFRDFAKAADIRLIILRGEGTAFCAGADLNWMQSMVKYSYDENVRDSENLWEMFASLRNCPIPVVGIAHGAVFGGALGLLACCDYVVADASTNFCFSEVKLGLAPAVITGFISDRIPDAYVRPLMLSAEVFKTDKAIQIGLVHEGAAQTPDVDVLVAKFSANGTEAMRETKKLLNLLLKENPAAKAACTRVISERRMSAEGQQRLQNFLNRTVRT